MTSGGVSSVSRLPLYFARIGFFLLLVTVAPPQHAEAQLPAHPGLQRTTAQLEITTDAGEKFHLVQTGGPVFDVYREVDGKKIGIANTATGEIAPDGPDYAGNGAALERAKAAFQKGQVHPYSPSGASVANTGADTQPEQAAGPISAAVLSFDAGKGSGTFAPSPQTATKGPITISHKGNRIDTEVIVDPRSGQSYPLAVEYQGNAATAALGSFGRDILQMGQGRTEMAGKNSLKVTFGKDSAFANHEVTVIDSNGNVADASRVGGSVGAQLLTRVKTAAPELIAALKSYGKSAGIEPPALPILYKVAGIPPDTAAAPK